MGKSIVAATSEVPFGVMYQALRSMVQDIAKGKDATMAALKQHADAVGAKLLIVGGLAVIWHGYRRTTDDRDVLVDYRRVRALAERMMDDPDWERLEIRQYAFLYRPSGVPVDFLVSGDLVQLGRPYLFPAVEEVESTSGRDARGIEGIDVIGLHDLLYLKLLAGRMQDLADIMELCKRHLGDIDPSRLTSRFEAEDQDLAATFLDLWKRAPIELENERRLGQQDRAE